MGNFEVIARLRVRPGQLEGFKTQIAELLRVTREQDKHTVRYDWFSNEDQTEWEVHEAYLAEAGLVEHNDHILEARNRLFREFAFDHRMSFYGEVSQQLRDLAKKHAGGASVYSFLQGLETVATV